MTLVVTTLWSAALVLGIGGPEVTTATSSAGLAAAALAAGGACLGAARRNTGRHRRVWNLLAASPLSWGAGQLVWTWYESILGQDPFPSLADVGYLGALLFAPAAMLAVPLASQNLAGRLRTILDGLLIASSLLLVSWVTVLGAILIGDAEGWLRQAISLAYPIGDVIAITIVGYVLLRSRQTAVPQKIPLGLIGGGLAAIAVADSGFLYLQSIGTYSSGSVIDIGWFLGYCGLLLAARKPPPVDATDAEDPPGRPLGLLAPYFAVVVALLVVVVEQLQEGRIEPFVSWVRSALILMLVVRQVLTVLENLWLTRHLEARVAERTAELQASEQRFEALVLHSSDVVTIVDVGGVVLYQSESIHRVFGYSAEALTGQSLAGVFEPADQSALLTALAAATREPYSVRVLELGVRHRDGRRCEAEVTVTNLLDDTSVAGLVLNTRDVSERKVLADQLVHQAFHDSLTGLANRALFADRVAHALLREGAHHDGVAVLFLDLDGFKQVNDSLGHAAGDQLLVRVAERLRGCLNPGDTVARLGGDEFAVLLESHGGRDATTVAERVTAALAEAVEVDGKQLHARASVGIAVAGDDVEDADQLLRNADLAMYRAKATGQGGFEMFDPEMHTHLMERLQAEADLRRALDSDQLVLHYQPTFSLATGKLVGVEALVRWQHPTRGLVQPAQFIGLAEETGLIGRLGEQVLEASCAQAMAWAVQHPSSAEMSIAVNISGGQLQKGDLAQQVAQILAKTGLAPARLVLEMTESVLMEHTDENLDLLGRLKALGIRLAIDDFGTGYSSLSYLHRFPVDVLKIDRSFVERLSDPVRDTELVRTIVALGQGLSMETVAEGIEDHHQLLILRRLGCTLGQGFHLSRPLTAEQVGRVLAQEAADNAPAAPVAPWSGRRNGTAPVPAKPRS